jgi:putative sigma-54 modulation protein
MNVPGDDFMVKNNVQDVWKAIELSAESLERLLVKEERKK